MGLVGFLIGVVDCAQSQLVVDADTFSRVVDDSDTVGAIFNIGSARRLPDPERNRHLREANWSE